MTNAVVSNSLAKNLQSFAIFHSSTDDLLQLDDFIQRTAVRQTFLHLDFTNPAILCFFGFNEGSIFYSGQVSKRTQTNGGNDKCLLWNLLLTGVHIFRMPLMKVVGTLNGFLLRGAQTKPFAGFLRENATAFS